MRLIVSELDSLQTHAGHFAGLGHLDSEDFKTFISFTIQSRNFSGPHCLPLLHISLDRVKVKISI